MSLSNIFDLQSHEQKKEGERFSYEVCDSKHRILHLADSPTKPKAQRASSLFSFACLDQADSEVLTLYLPLPAAAVPFTNQQERLGNEDQRQCQEGRQAAGILSPPLSR